MKTLAKLLKNRLFPSDFVCCFMRNFHKCQKRTILMQQVVSTNLAELYICMDVA